MILCRLLKLWENTHNEIRLLLKAKRSTCTCQKDKMEIFFFWLNITSATVLITGVKSTEPKNKSIKAKCMCAQCVLKILCESVSFLRPFTKSAIYISPKLSWKNAIFTKIVRQLTWFISCEVSGTNNGSTGQGSKYKINRGLGLPHQAGFKV